MCETFEKKIQNNSSMVRSHLVETQKHFCWFHQGISTKLRKRAFGRCLIVLKDFIFYIFVENKSFSCPSILAAQYTKNV